MEKQSEKVAPAYGSWATVTRFINDLRDHGANHLPSKIDRSLMTNLSGSTGNETISSLKALGLVSSTGETTPFFGKFVLASDEERKPLLAEMIRASYGFLFSAKDFNLDRATGQMCADLFREQGVTGSTLVRAMTFFLSAAKEAGISVSPKIKPPKLVKNGSARTKKEKGETLVASDLAPPLPPAGASAALNDVHKFELPIPGKPSVIVLIPKALDGDDWDMFQQMFEIYVKRWKNFKEKGPDSA